ncbi:response regulator [Candidatus Symbiobacter mobilis]|uniref:CheY-like chemotaxis protein n=1 Tax=Candidatus Symbiobacter mobilis CR TaxID=946483 RepID=U5N7Y0_9BURK|nr:response regulator [Candidatus Symbiobacter mobilis]AGX86309.1 CheY-like chemotaxis protein [Candidatus Symbiobacter mobilis CR]
MGTALSVLLVDDDEFSRDVLKEMLVAQGVTDVRMADSGLSALQTLSTLAHQPDLMICDVFMPDMDGIEFMSALAARKYRGGVVLVSGVNIETLSMARDLASAAGIQLLGSFVKPLHREVLAEVLAGLGHSR